MPRLRPIPEIFLVSLAAILLEVSYTRIFSYKLVYFFTYLVIGLALLGLGSGGVLVALVRSFRRIAMGRLLAVLSLCGALSVAIGYVVVAWVPMNAFDMIRHAGAHDQGPAVREAAKLVVISAALFAPFLCAGIVFAIIFATNRDDINRLYAADLLGAGLGCAASVVLMSAISPPGCAILGGACFALAGIRVARAEAPRLVPPLVLLAAVLFAGAVAGPTHLPDPIVDIAKTMNPKDRPPVLFSRWSPVFRVDVLDSPPARKLGYVLAHDGMWGSILPRFDGDPASLAHYDSDARAIPFAVVPPHPTVTIIGAAGGNEILASLHWDAAHVTAVELNPVTVSLLTTHFTEFTGHMAADRRVTLVNAEGRAFFEGASGRSDLVWFVAPDSYAAMNAATSGAYVLSESYLYTTEMLEAAFAHLAPDGIVCAQFGEINYDHKPNRTTRYLTTAREALRRLGIDDFERHVLVATSPGFAFTTSTILLRREPFTERDVALFAARVAATGSLVRFPVESGVSDHAVARVISLPTDQLQQWYATYPFDVRPVTDDRPFFWHFVPFRSALRSTLTPGALGTEEGLGELLLLALLGLVTAFATICLLAPLLLRRTLWRTIPHKTAAGIYFAALGLGFMFFEVTLIQRLTLFLGYPTYSLTVTLFALLVSTGIGSLLSERAIVGRDRAVAIVGGVLVVLVGLYLRALGPITASVGAAPFATRVAVAVTVLSPLGLCLGMFMPLGLRSVAALTPHAEEYVAWAWAVNGFFSVVASVLATLLSMTFGFEAVMLLALAIYVVAIAALRRIPTSAASA
jgi:spermidine synthase